MAKCNEILEIWLENSHVYVGQIAIILHSSVYQMNDFKAEFVLHKQSDY